MMEYRNGKPRIWFTVDGEISIQKKRYPILIQI